ncbi:hypothetical protein OS493_015324 [Desmophyllum pertusum]|uniref:YDG domain-containing protein n=1 Tax=Desmophyllum pertusum TaxID=174260 RepID=A0A9W9ZD58_9CNID|nr:hypothetical protein OS493_015324 [Desmophyllum pertusum]
MKGHVSEYELQRQKNINENKKILASLGLDKFELFVARPAVTRKPVQTNGVKRKRQERQVKTTTTEHQPIGEHQDFRYQLRRSSRRLKGQDPSEQEEQNNNFDDDEDEDYKKPLRAPKNRENVFGEIPGSPVGSFWFTRLACCIDGVHRPTVAGIHGNDVEGCYSLALSGGYEDDLDYGVCFTYTGEGGRDLKGTKANPKNLRTAPQSKDQTLTRGNLALSRNAESGKPVRVIRGYKSKSPYAPEEGYRYDGLYTVAKYWQVCGLSGFLVYKFALKRCDGQAPPPWELENEDDTDAAGSDVTETNGYSD